MNRRDLAFDRSRKNLLSVSPKPCLVVIKLKRPAGISRNLISYWLAFLVSAGTGFFLSPYVVNHLGNTGYGIWTLLTALVGYLGLLDFGVRGTVTRYIAHHHAVGDSISSSAIVSAGLIMFTMLGTLAIAIAASFAYFSPLMFTIPEGLVLETRLVLIVGGTTMAATLIGAVFGGVVTGLERFDVSSGIEISVTLLRTLAVVISLGAGYGLVTLAFIHFFASVINGLATWVAARRLYPDLRINFKTPLLPHMRTILSFSFYLSALHVFSALIFYSDALVIAAFLPVSSVTYFAIAGNLGDYARQVASAFSMLMTPRVSALTAIGSAEVANEIASAARLATLVTAPIALTFWVRGESFINLWMGPEFGTVSGQVLRILSFVVLFAGARQVATSSIIGVNKHRELIPALAFEAVSNVLLSIALVRPFDVAGVALGTMIPNLLVGLLFIPHYLQKSTGIPMLQFYHRAWFLPFFACIPFLVCSYLIERYIPATNLAIFFVQVGMILPTVGLGAFAVCLSETERKAITAGIFNVFRSVFRRGEK